MTEQQGDKTTATPTPASPTDAQAQNAAKAALTDLMATVEPRADAKKAAPTKAAPDLEAEALRAAERALAEGQKALAAARSQVAIAEPKAPARRSGRELFLRALLALNILAMIGIAMLPAPKSGARPTTVPDEHGVVPAPHVGEQPQFNDPWNRALAAAESRDFAQAVAILDQYLASSPRMAASQQLSVLMALAHYSARRNDFRAAQEYQRRADAIEKSHSLPEDLVATAKAAAENGDQEQLRRIWARFLLQQRQVPSWLYKHVAEAYLQLGDSYRLQANTAAEAARLQELENTAAALKGQEQGNARHK